MTFSSVRRYGFAALLSATLAVPALAAGALGEFHRAARPVTFAAGTAPGLAPNPVPSPSMASAQTPLPYSLAEEVRSDGSRIRRYLAANGQVFAISWKTLYKPDLSNLLGASFPEYASAAHTAAQRGGIQRQFRMDAADLVLQSAGHLHVFSGLAYKPSLMPSGVTAQTLGWS